MAVRSKTRDVTAEIVLAFQTLDKRILTYSDVRHTSEKKFYNPDSRDPMSLHQFLRFVVEKKMITIEEVKFLSRTYVRYVRGNVPLHELLLSFHDRAYFSHHTSMQIHKLTKVSQNRIYFNIEQSPKQRDGDTELTQEGIDRAFKLKPRVTKNIADYKSQKIFLLNGKNTNNLGVENIPFEKTKHCRTTNLERTLIDITVRPAHSGGVSEVFQAYKIAKDKLNAETVVSMLRELDYVYPYHQAIGFYMQRAGYDEWALKLMRDSRPIKYNFYLTHEMKRTDYSNEWRLYYPKEL